MSEFGHGEKAGIGTVMAEEHDSSAPVPGTVGPQARLPLCELAEERAGAELDVAARGPGRPPGAKNKSTEEWRRYLLSRYPSPLVGLCEIYSRSPADLAKELGLKSAPNYQQVLELFRIQLQCMKEALPYLHQKQPMAVEAKGDGLMTLVINTTAADVRQAQGAEPMVLDFIDSESVQNQGLSQTENGELHASELHGGGEAVENKGECAAAPTDGKSGGIDE